MNNSQNGLIKVAVFAGARSTEHEVSLASAYNIVNAIDQTKYEIFVVGIDKKGVWRQYAANNFVKNPTNFSKIALSDKPISGRLTVTQCSNKFFDIDDNGKAVFECDVIFPAVLGNYAEDGTIQGLIRMMDVPFTTADVLGSSVGMDKDVSYRLLQAKGINIAEFVTLRPNSDKLDFTTLQKKLKSEIIFVKPANAGSSVGVSRVTNQNEYEEALDLAFNYDVKVIVQAGIVGRELEISIMGNIGNQKTSTAVGEIIQVKKDNFYSYGNKYINVENSNLLAPAKVSPELYKKLSQAAVATCEALECEGFGRVDFFVDENEKVYVNEINTMPGFTKISMFPRLWIESGISYSDVIDQLLQLAIERHRYRIEPMVLDANDIIERIQSIRDIELGAADDHSKKSAATSIIETTVKILAKLFVAIKKPKVVAIAGSVGKTSTKIFLSALLASEKTVSHMDDSYNSGLGLYMSVFRQKVPTKLNSPISWIKLLAKTIGKFFEKGTEIIVLEYGIDCVGEMDQMIKFITPDVAMVTAVTPEHMEFLKTIDQVAQEELKIVSAANDFSVINGVDIDEKYLKNIKAKIFTYGSDKASASYEVHEWTKTGAIVSFNVDDMKIEKIKIRLISEPLIRQLSGAILTAKMMGISKAAIEKTLKEIEPTYSRMVMLEGTKGSTLIDDTTNFSPVAGIEALKALKRIPAKRRIAVLGNMHELGEYADQGFADVAEHFKTDIDVLVLVGELSIEKFSASAKSYGFIKDKNLFLLQDAVSAGIFLRDHFVKQDDVILVKGPFGGYYLEETVKKLLANPNDAKKLTRQSDFWIIKKRQHFGSKFDK
jgi:D-alanine-D-alanine ligase